MTKKCVKDYVEITIGTKKKKISIYNISNTPNYYYYFRHNGVKHQGSCGSGDLETSKNNVREIFYEITKGLRQKGRKKRMKLEDIVNDFLKFKKEHQLSSKTLVEYKRQSNYILEWFNTQSKGSEINVFFSTSKYDDYCNWRRNYYEKHKSKRGRSFETISNTSLNRECRLLCSILRYGKEHKGILKDVHVPSYKMFPETRREEILKKTEYIDLKKYWMEKNSYIWDIFSFLNNTGLRPNELNKITYGNVHLDDGYVLIKNRKNKNKTKSIDTPVPLVGSSREIIEKLMSREGISKGNDDLVFVNDSGHQYTTPYLSKLFKKSVKLITGQDMTLYSLRHLFTSRMIKRPDIPIKVLSYVLGHTSTDMLNKVYSHLDDFEPVVNIFERTENHKREILKEQREQDKQNKTDSEPDVL